MTITVAAVVILAAICGAAAAGLYLAWPRRLTAEEWILHRRSMSTPGPPSKPSANPITRFRAPLVRIERIGSIIDILRADVELLRLLGEPAPAGAQEFVSQLLIRAAAGGVGGLALLGLAAAGAGGTRMSPIAVLLPLIGALLVPARSWLSLRRRAARLRRAVEHRLPRVLMAARVLLDSGAATPEGALTHAVSLHEDPAADLVREALLAKEVRRLPLEAALEEVAQRHGVTELARLADSVRVGTRYGTRMAELLGDQSVALRQSWFSAYRERITRAPVTMTIPALFFFLAPLLVLIVYLVFTPLVGALGQL